ncbi:hypothetical protein ANTPLA_LOCUS3070 [Anthophora plagiata]
MSLRGWENALPHNRAKHSINRRCLRIVNLSKVTIILLVPFSFIHFLILQKCLKTENIKIDQMYSFAKSHFSLTILFASLARNRYTTYRISKLESQGGNEFGYIFVSHHE